MLLNDKLNRTTRVRCLRGFRNRAVRIAVHVHPGRGAHHLFSDVFAQFRHRTVGFPGNVIVQFKRMSAVH